MNTTITKTIKDGIVTATITDGELTGVTIIQSSGSGGAGFPVPPLTYGVFLKNLKGVKMLAASLEAVLEECS